MQKYIQLYQQKGYVYLNVMSLSDKNNNNNNYYYYYYYYIICLFSNLVACTKLQKMPKNIQKAAIYSTSSAKRLRVLKRDDAKSPRFALACCCLVAPERGSYPCIYN